MRRTSGPFIEVNAEESQHKSRLSVEALIRHPGRCEASIRQRELRLFSDSDDEGTAVVTTVGAVSNAMQCAWERNGLEQARTKTQSSKSKRRGKAKKAVEWTNGPRRVGSFRPHPPSPFSHHPGMVMGHGDSTVQQPTIIGQPDVTLTGLERRGTRYWVGGGIDQLRPLRQTNTKGQHDVQQANKPTRIWGQVGSSGRRLAMACERGLERG